MFIISAPPAAEVGGIEGKGGGWCPEGEIIGIGGGIDGEYIAVVAEIVKLTYML